MDNPTKTALERVELQHARNLAQLERCRRQTAANRERTRKNARYLKWWGWFPMASMVRDAQRDLDKAQVELDEAVVELERADAKLVALLEGSRD